MGRYYFRQDERRRLLPTESRRNDTTRRLVGRVRRCPKWVRSNGCIPHHVWSHPNRIWLRVRLWRAGPGGERQSNLRHVLCAVVSNAKRRHLRPYETVMERPLKRRHVALCFVVASVMTACSGPSPAGPSSTSSALVLRTGRQLLSLTGFSSSPDPNRICTPPGLPPSGPLVYAYVQLEQSGAEWVARTRPGDEGSIELRLRDAGFRQMGGQAVVGTIRGMASDSDVDVFHSATTVRALISDVPGSGLAELDGSASIASHVWGRIVGSITFSDSLGRGCTSREISFSLQPRQE